MKQEQGAESDRPSSHALDFRHRIERQAMIQKRSKVLLMAARLATLAVPIAVCVVSAAQSQSQPQTQTVVVSAPIHEYDVVSVKPNRSDSKGSVFSFPGDGI